MAAPHVQINATITILRLKSPAYEASCSSRSTFLSRCQSVFKWMACSVMRAFAQKLVNAVSVVLLHETRPYNPSSMALFGSFAGFMNSRFEFSLWTHLLSCRPWVVICLVWIWRQNAYHKTRSNLHSVKAISWLIGQDSTSINSPLLHRTLKFISTYLYLVHRHAGVLDRDHSSPKVCRSETQLYMKMCLSVWHEFVD